MESKPQTFTIASDDRLIDLIRKARHRLVVVSPALTESVARALVQRFPDEGRINITIVLDADPEVYRLGFGDQAALTMLRDAASLHQIGLSAQPGLRIGMIVSDDDMMIFSPVPRLIEAGSNVVERPNAIFLDGGAVDRAANAAGAGTDGAATQEVGNEPLTPDMAKDMAADLAANPPQSFDIARAVRVFSSRLQYVELKVQNCRFSGRRIPLPPELLNVADQKLKDRISGGIKPPADALGPFTIELVGPDGRRKRQKIDEGWFVRERERIEQAYTFEVPKYGRVILRSERPEFDHEVDRFEANLRSYRDAVNISLENVKAGFAKTIVTEFLPRWKQRPPEFMTRFTPRPSVQELREELERLASELVSRAFVFEEPTVRIVPKEISPESAGQPDFLNRLKGAMVKKRIPTRIIDSMFRRFGAAEGAELEFDW